MLGIPNFKSMWESGRSNFEGKYTQDANCDEYIYLEWAGLEFP